jgi:N-acetylmuramic acid 6-phosphate etherase
MPRRSRSSSTWKRLPTEAAHAASARLDRLDAARIVARMQAEDRRVLQALAGARGQIVRAAETLREVYLSGGNCLIFGAGTSGRLGVLEAAELPPTFGTSAPRVRAFMAGGRGAVFRAREGAEDSRREGERQAGRAGFGDLVVGVSASGVTPFVRGALAGGRRGGARTILVTANPSPALRRIADVVVALRVGPEVVAGSTRLKAGTATKLALNQITTSAFATSGRVFGPWMVDLSSRGSRKLADRAERVVAAASGTTAAKARRALREARGEVKTAIFAARTGVGASAARAALARTGGDLRKALMESKGPRRRA